MKASLLINYSRISECCDFYTCVDKFKKTQKFDKKISKYYELTLDIFLYSS